MKSQLMFHGGLLGLGIALCSVFQVYAQSVAVFTHPEDPTVKIEIRHTGGGEVEPQFTLLANLFKTLPPWHFKGFSRIELRPGNAISSAPLEDGKGMYMTGDDVGNTLLHATEYVGENVYRNVLTDKERAAWNNIAHFEGGVLASHPMHRFTDYYLYHTRDTETNLKSAFDLAASRGTPMVHPFDDAKNIKPGRASTIPARLHLFVAGIFIDPKSQRIWTYDIHKDEKRVQKLPVIRTQDKLIMGPWEFAVTDESFNKATHEVMYTTEPKKPTYTFAQPISLPTTISNRLPTMLAKPKKRGDVAPSEPKVKWAASPYPPSEYSDGGHTLTE